MTTRALAIFGALLLPLAGCANGASGAAYSGGPSDAGGASQDGSTRADAPPPSPSSSAPSATGDGGDASDRDANAPEDTSPLDANVSDGGASDAAPADASDAEPEAATDATATDALATDVQVPEAAAGDSAVADTAPADSATAPEAGGPDGAAGPTGSQCFMGWPQENGECPAPIITSAYFGQNCVGTTGVFIVGENFEYLMAGGQVADYGPTVYGLQGSSSINENWNVLTETELCVTTNGDAAWWTGRTIYMVNPDGKMSNTVVTQ